MSAKVYDLSAYLEQKPATIKLGDEEFAISDGFNDLLKIDALSERKGEMSTKDFIKEFLSISLGEDVANELISRNYKTVVYIKIMNCIEKEYSGMTDEEQEGASSERSELV
jgi:hypothetical protein